MIALAAKSSPDFAVEFRAGHQRPRHRSRGTVCRAGSGLSRNRGARSRWELAHSLCQRRCKTAPGNGSLVRPKRIAVFARGCGGRQASPHCQTVPEAASAGSIQMTFHRLGEVDDVLCLGFVAARASGSAPDKPFVILFAAKLCNDQLPDTRQLRSQFGLTHAQAKLAIEIAKGKGSGLAHGDWVSP